MKNVKTDTSLVKQVPVFINTEYAMLAFVEYATATIYGCSIEHNILSCKAEIFKSFVNFVLKNANVAERVHR